MPFDLQAPAVRTLDPPSAVLAVAAVTFLPGCPKSKPAVDNPAATSDPVLASPLLDAEVAAAATSADDATSAAWTIEVGDKGSVRIRYRGTQLVSLLMLLVTRNFLRHRIRDTLILLAQDGLTGRNVKRRLYAYLLWKPGILRRILPAWLAYFLPGFHPWNEDDRHLLRDYESTAKSGAEPKRKVRRWDCVTRVRMTRTSSKRAGFL